MNIDLVLKRLKLIKEGKGIGTISDTEASIILNEIERLNNIINELEKWLENINKLYKDTRISYVEAISDTLDKIKELKGE